MHGDAHRADLDDLAVLERLELERRLGERVDGDGQGVLEREASVPRHVVGVGVGLEHPLDPHPGLARSLDDRLDLQRRIDDRPRPLRRSRRSGSWHSRDPRSRTAEEQHE